MLAAVVGEAILQQWNEASVDLMRVTDSLSVLLAMSVKLAGSF
jgi:hypothetical protein